MCYIGRAQWLIIFLTYPIYALSPCHVRYSFININCSFRNSMEVSIPANFFPPFCISSGTEESLRGGVESLCVFGWFCFILELWIIQWDLKGVLAFAPF